MKSQDPLSADPAARWSVQKLPVGLTIACTRESSDLLDISLPVFEEKGLVLTYMNYKGHLHILPVSGPEQQASPALGLLTVSDRPLRFRSDAPVQFAAVAFLIPDEWIALFLSGNTHFKKIEQVLTGESNIVTCRMGRRQLSLFSALLAAGTGDEANLLEVQNNVLSLVEYFLCNRHRSLLGAGTSSGIDNEDDLSLIREVESYISEYYCSDTFTVDAILKKTYTSYHRLNFLFKSIHGMTISEYIRNKRIEKSKEMIADNVKSISQIAYEIGYSSISNYILAFKKIYQITPGKYKKQIDSLA